SGDMTGVIVVVVEDAQYSKSYQKEEKKIATEPENTDDGKVVISKEYYDELMQIKAALRKLSMAVLDLENHEYEYKSDPSSLNEK
ncbi:MAG: hypothetical protein I4N51_20215, partial [Acinetobacter sp.]|nr:hypothetical protein [Acinetobacter sp.]